jgi:alpha-beta hydrolase superfamily lysophospholipase
MTFFTEIEDARNIINQGYALNNYKKIIVLGFSMGGAVSTRVSLEFMDKIDKMILLDFLTLSLKTTHRDKAVTKIL